ncbi:MAG: SpoIIE family protein phosphatase [Syntrophobacteraceae bacterium]
MIRQILVENQDKLEKWKRELSDALGPNAKLLLDVIPDLEHIIGGKPAVEPMGPEESQNRFIRLFKNFIGVLATAQHPVVLFLDDMQWIDPASINLVTALVTDPEVAHFFFIASYRDKEVSASHPVIPALQKMSQEGGNLITITLDPLKEEDVRELLSHSYKTHASAIPELASLVFKKTEGNPFFAIQFIKRLHEDGLIQFFPGKGWHWDNDRITAMPLTDNVVELMVQAIGRIPPAGREVITVCACIGNSFDLEIAAEVMERGIEEMLPVFDSLINAGLIAAFKNTYRFHHDRIQEAAYSLLDEKTRCRLHYKIGNNALRRTPHEKLHDKVFFIVRHLNLSAALISNPEERLALARLNLSAGKKAKDASAFDSALTYFRLGTALLPTDGLEHHYDLAFPLFINQAECEYLMGNHETAMTLFETLSGRAKTRLDLAQIYIVRVFLLTNIGKYEDAVLFGLEGLRIFNVKLPLKPTMLTVIKEILKMKWALLGRNIEQLIDLPMIEDPEIIVAIRMLESCSQAVYYTNKNLVLISPFIWMRIILQHGNCYLSPYVLGMVAGIVGPGLGDYKTADKFYQLSNQLLEKIDHEKIGSVYFVQAYLYIHWAKHIKDSIALFQKAYTLFLDIGSFEFACHSLNNILDYSFIMGRNIDEIFEEYKQYENFIKSQKDAFFDAYFNDNIRKYLCYKGLTDGLHTFDRDDGYVDKRLGEIRNTKNNLDKFIYLCNLIKINYLAGKFTEAYGFAKEIEPLKNDLIGNLHLPEFVFYYALTICAMCRAKPPRRVGPPSKIKRLIGRMKKWSAVCPQNYEHKYFLMAAELESLRGRNDKAEQFYLKAADSCAQQGFLNNEALAHELLGEFYIACSEDGKAAKQIRLAHRCYLLWGATAKAAALEGQYPHLISSKVLVEAKDNDSTQSNSLGTPRSAKTLDLSSALKAAATVSSELVLEKLLKKLLRILLENAGAQRGFLILETDGRLAIEARVEMLDKGISVLESIPVTEKAGLSPAIVQFALRTKEKVILHDAAKDPLYGSDPHIVKNRSKSILCLPIVNQGKVTAILYLENNLTTNAFTPERIEFLSVFTSQAAVSIDNARLYANLEKKVEDRTHQLKVARDALWGEMRLAAKIQTLLLPKQPCIPGYEVFGYMLPADEVGGDYYDIINTDEVDWVLIGDVAGHGVSAGLVMMMVQTSIQTLIRENASIMPRDLLAMANRTVAYNIGLMDDDKYITLTACRLSRDGRIIFSGLHQDMFVYRALSASVERIETRGMWLGFEMDLFSMISNSEIQMREGDVLLLYTDGITEARNDRGEMFEQERIAEVLEKS